MAPCCLMGSKYFSPGALLEARLYRFGNERDLSENYPLHITILFKFFLCMCY